MPHNPSLLWQKLQDVYYSLRTCYDTLAWPIDNLYSNYRVAISRNTTVLALASKFVPHPNIIDVYSISGNKYWSVVYNSHPSDHIVDFGFRNEDLVVVLSNQKFRYYRDFKGTFDEYSYTENLIKLDQLGEEDASHVQNRFYVTNLENNQPEDVFHVREVKVWDRYLLLKLHNRHLITDLHTLRNYEIPFSKFEHSKFHFVNPLSVENDLLTLLVGYDQTIISVKADLGSLTYEIVDHGLTDGPFTQITASPNCALIALFNAEASKIFVINSAFDQVLLEYDTSNESSAPYQVEWCGNDAIILSLRDEIKLIGPGQRSISFFYDVVEEEEFDLEQLLKDNAGDDLSFTIPLIKTEKDGLKIITTNKVEFLSMVPETVVNLYQIGSSHPSSILLDCVDKLLEHSSKADTNISFLKAEDALELAMSECLQATLEEFSPLWQKKILKAVSFGKIYYDNYYDADKYLKIVNYVKILNQLRSNEIGLFLTYNEMIDIGWKGILKKLLRRDLYYLAIKIIDLLDLKELTDLVYVHWCSYKIKKDLNSSDINLFKIIARKLVSALPVDSNQPLRNYISIDEILNVAFEEGRINLCKLLINLEPSVPKKIQYFLRFEEVELALIKSFQTADYDLARLLLLYLQDNLSTSQFYKILNQNEQRTAISDTSLSELKELKITTNILYESLFISGDLIGNFWVRSIGKYRKKLLEEYYRQEDKKLELLKQKLSEFLFKGGPIAFAEEALQHYHEEYKTRLTKLMNRTGSRRSVKLYQYELEVLNLKKKLSETYQKSFFDAVSVMDVISKLIKMNQLKQASKVVKDMKISNAKFWHTVLEILSKNGDFENLMKFAVANNPSSGPSKTRMRSPIGFRPFVDTGIAFGAPKDHLTTYVENCFELPYGERVEMFIAIGDLPSAAEEAFKHKDSESLNAIYDKAKAANNDNVMKSVRNGLSKLGHPLG